MKEKIKRISSQMTRRRGATQESLQALAAHFRVELPDDYVQFMTYTDGAEGPIGKEYLRIWAVEDVISRNESLAYLTEDHPELLFFGSFGGGSAYAFDTRYHPMPVVDVDMIDSDYIQKRGKSFEDFLENLCVNEK